MSEQIGFHVKAGTCCFKHPNLRALRLQQHQEAQRIRVGHIQIVAGNHPYTRGLARAAFTRRQRDM